MAIEARIGFDVATREWIVGLTDDDGRIGYSIDSAGRFVQQHVDKGGHWPVLFRCESRELQLLAEALAEHGFRPIDTAKPEVEARAAHLTDAIATRDRLLAIVERA